MALIRSDEGSRFRTVLTGIITVFLIVIVIAVISFFITLRGSEIITVPNLENVYIVDALEMLQARGLIPHIQTRYSQYESGTIISQRPGLGTQVRIGRTVNLTVSLGPIIDTVGDYRGMTIDELRDQLETQFASYETILAIQSEQISYIYSEEEAQTIIAQDPPAGTSITEYTELRLLVSRGQRPAGLQAPNIIGLEFDQALGLVALRDIPFVFQFTNANPSAEPGRVLSQRPAPGETITDRLEIDLSPIEENPNSISGIFTGLLPDSNTPLNIVVQFLSAIGELMPYFQTTRLGGEFSFPYQHDVNSQIQILINGELIDPAELQNPSPSLNEGN